jgi:hypothetical protein
MLKIDYEALGSATAFLRLEVTGYALAQIELDVIDQAARFFQCGADEIVLVGAPTYEVISRDAIAPFAPKFWRGKFHLALVSVDRNHLMVNAPGEGGNDED